MNAPPASREHTHFSHPPHHHTGPSFDGTAAPVIRDANPHRHPSRRRPKTGWRRLVAWEWGFVMLLLMGLAIAASAMTKGPAPQRQADIVEAELRAALLGRPVPDPLFGAAPSLDRSHGVGVATVSGLPPKVCVLASWDLVRTGSLSVNGVSPQRMTAAKLVELCNQAPTATISWGAH